MIRHELSTTEAQALAYSVLKSRCAVRGNHLVAIYGHGNENSNLEAITHWVEGLHHGYCFRAAELLNATLAAFDQFVPRLLMNLSEEERTISYTAMLPSQALTGHEERMMALALQYLASIGLSDGEYAQCRLQLCCDDPFSFTAALHDWVVSKKLEYCFHPSELTRRYASRLFGELRASPYALIRPRASP